VRDLSLVCGAELEAEALLARARAAGGELLRTVAVTDRYQGPPVPEGKLSLTLTLRFQLAERTLTGEEVQACLAGIAQALAGAGAEIRGE
jgi:phenylalanyl-tRNA synthetase beta chain